MKKIALIMLLGMLGSGSVAMAEYSVVCDNQSRTITFKLTDGVEKPLVVYVQDADGNIIALGDTTVDGNDHRAVLPIPLNAQADKIYTAVIEDYEATDDKEGIPFSERSKEIYISDASRNSTILEEISTKTGEALESAFGKYYKELDVDISTGFTKSFAQAFDVIRSDREYNRFSDIKADYELAGAAAFLADAQQAELLGMGRHYLQILGISAEFENREKEMWYAFGNVRENITSKTVIPSDMESWCNEALAVSAVNTSDRETMSKVIEEYADVLGLDTDKYTSLKTETKKMSVNKALHAKNFKNAESVKKAYDEAVAELLKTKPSGGGSGGGGSGGGGTKTSYTPSSTTLPYDKDEKNTIVPEENNPEENNSEENASEKKDFSDLNQSHWAYEAMMAIAQKGIISGYSDNTVKPDNFVSRAEFIKILVSATDKHIPDAVCSFSDVDRHAWYYGYIASAANGGIVNGYEDNTFKPDDVLTRQDAALMIYRAIQLSPQGDSDFADKESISDYALEAVMSLSGSGIINGFENGEFRPNENITRAQTAQIIFNLIKEG